MNANPRVGVLLRLAKASPELVNAMRPVRLKGIRWCGRHGWGLTNLPKNLLPEWLGILAWHSVKRSEYLKFLK